MKYQSGPLHVRWTSGTALREFFAPVLEGNSGNLKSADSGTPNVSRIEFKTSDSNSTPVLRKVTAWGFENTEKPSNSK